MTVVMRYVRSSQLGSGPLIMKQSDAKKSVVIRRAGIPVEYGVKGQELMRILRKGAEQFIRAMELQGLELIPLPEGNPQCVTNADGTPRATYSITHDLMKAQPDELIDQTIGGPASAPTLKVPMSLEDSKGTVDYQLIGAFLAPEVAVEVLKRREDILAAEKAAKNARTWGGGRSTPNVPSIG